jgi:alkanesulfonate monooxygenase SsuD/methylene tetrahydromethanopterin reductase-like flavin-dependent oxidoreductase (luciferase family)
MVKIGFYQVGLGWSYKQLRDYWVEADKLGFDSGHIMDNTIYARPDGSISSVHEAWTFLAAIAEATSNIRIGPQVTPTQRRAPALFAKITAEVDHISNGRVFVGMGVGDMSKYHLPWGMPFPEKLSERAKIMREEIEVMKLMWTEEKANYEGNYYTLRNAQMLPKPVQQPNPPIYIGIGQGTKITPRVAADLADGVLLCNGSDQAVRELLAAIEEHCKDVGRDFGSFHKERMVSVVMLEDENDRSYLEWHDEMKRGDARFRSRDAWYPPPRELNPGYQTVSLKEQSAFIRDIAAAGGTPDEVSPEGFEGVEPPREGYSVHYITHRFVIGTPDQVARELKEIVDMGLDELVILGLETIEDLQRFASEVMPYVRE